MNELKQMVSEDAREDTPVTLGRRQADRMLDALVGMYEIDEVSDLLQHALCDLRHFADAHGLDFAARDKKGHCCYLAEKEIGAVGEGDQS